MTTDNHNKSVDPLSEEGLKQLFGRLPEAEINPWFTRRVLNRLPERRRRMAGRIEYAVYIIALLWMIGSGVWYLYASTPTGLTVGVLLNYIAWLGIVGSLVYALIEPRIYAIKK